MPQERIAGHVSANKSGDLSPASHAPSLQSLGEDLNQMLLVVNRAGGGSILHNVAVSVRDHYDVPRLETQAVAAVQPHRGAPFGEQVIDDHMLGFSLKVARQCAGTGGINTPGGRKLAVVKKGSLKPNRSQ